MNAVKKVKLYFLSFSIVSVVLGLCVIIWPHISALTLCYILGLVLVVVGVVKTIFYFRGSSFGIPHYSELIFGLLDAIVGLILILHPGDAVMILPIVIGLVIILDGLIKLQTSIEIKRVGVARWWRLFALATLSALFGFLLVLKPFAGASAMMVLLGLALVIDGAQNIFTYIYVSKYLKKDGAIATYTIE